MTQAYPDAPFEEVVARLASVGYDGLEPLAGPEGQLKPAELRDGDRRAINALLRDHGVTIPVLNPFKESMVLMGRDGTARRFYGDIMDLAVDLGVSTVNFLSGFLPDGDTEGWRILIDSVRQLCRYAESCGLNFAIHNHEATILDSAEKCRLFMDHVGSPCLRMTFDATNCHLLNGDVVREVRESGNRIAHVHLKGLRGRYPFAEFLVPGEKGDEMDFPAFAQALGDVDYSGHISVETFARHRDDKDCVAYDMMHAALTALRLRG